jgi:hypothetical protein
MHFCQWKRREFITLLNSAAAWYKSKGIVEFIQHRAMRHILSRSTPNDSGRIATAGKQSSATD